MRDNVQELGAGAELDAMVAEALGWTATSTDTKYHIASIKGRRMWVSPERTEELLDVPHPYSTDPGLAFSTLWPKMLELCGECCVHYDPVNPKGEAWVWYYVNQDQYGQAEGKRADIPLLLCRAFLAVVQPGVKES